MNIPVHMLAFYENRGAVRYVDIPDAQYSEANGKIEDILELVFYYGQNDFQPLRMYSVSVGDVAEVNGEYWMVMGVGWRQLSRKEFDMLDAPTSTFAHELGLVDYFSKKSA